MTVQLPAESYAQTKACLEARARQIPSDDEDPSEDKVSSRAGFWRARSLKGQDPHIGPSRSSGQGPLGGPGGARDQRPHDAFIDLIATGVHRARRARAPRSSWWPMSRFSALVQDTDSGELTELAGELEHDGLITTPRPPGASPQTPPSRWQLDASRGRPHHVRGPGPALPDRGPTPRGAAARPTMSLPGLQRADLHHHPSHRGVETGRTDRRRQHLPHDTRHHHGVVHRRKPDC